jgi:hypothetical protein
MAINLTKSAPEARSDIKSYYLNSLRDTIEVQKEQRKTELTKVWEKAVRDENLRKLRTTGSHPAFTTSARPAVSGMIATLTNMVAAMERKVAQQEPCSTTA